MINESIFDVPWWYRYEFDVVNGTEHALLTFKGINYKADIWLNGKLLADSTSVVGTFRYFDYDISGLVSTKAKNVIALRITRPNHNNDFPYRDPNTDLALSFMDWVQPPADANMGIWRGVDLYTSPTRSPVIRYPVVNTKLYNNNTMANLTVVFELIGVGVGIPGTVTLRID